MDNSIDAIFCEEAIEHVSKGECARLLAECLRILRPGGVMRVTTPDLNYLARRIGEHERAGDDMNDMFYAHGHQYLYTREELKKACKQVGFVALKPSCYRDTDSVLGHLDTHADRFGHPEQLAQYLEMQKPGETPFGRSQ